MNKILNDVCDVVNPFSQGFKAARVEVGKWKIIPKIITVALSILLTPFLVLPGILFFRWAAYAFKKNENQPQVNLNQAGDQMQPVVLHPVNDQQQPVIVQNQGNDQVQPVIVQSQGNDQEQPVIVQNQGNDQEQPVIVQNQGNDQEQPVVVQNQGDDQEQPIVQNQPSDQLQAPAPSYYSWFASGVQNLAGKIVNTTTDVLNVAKDTFKESTDRKCVEWKVRKYEESINQLLAGMTENGLGSHDKSTTTPITHIKDRLIDCKKSFNDDYRFDPENIQKHLKEVRSVYDGVITALRSALKVKDDPKYSQLIKLCEILFTQDLNDVSNYTLKVFNKAEDQPAFNADMTLADEEIFDDKLENFTRQLSGLHHKIDAVPAQYKTPHLSRAINGARGSVNEGFDPYTQGNVPHKQYVLDINGKKVMALGMGTPTRETRSSNLAELNEEFEGFIQSYKVQGKKHLFILNQDITSQKNYVGNEGTRCRLILDAQDKEENKDALYCIALSKNTSFYQQKVEGSSDSEMFMTTLANQFLTLKSHQSGCYIPDSIKKIVEEDSSKEFDVFLNEMIHEIHAKEFNSAELLTQKERQAFIEIFYDTLTIYLLATLEVDSFNTTCKDAIDRGAASNAQLFASVALVNDGTLVQKIKNKIAELMMVRSLFVRKRAPIKERVERLIVTLDHMLKKIPIHQELINSTLEGHTISILNY